MFTICVLFGGGGALLVRHARSLPMPDRTRPPEIAAVVFEVLATPCRRRRNSGTCFRPVASFAHEGQTQQVAARGIYSHSPVQKGDPVAVLVDKQGGPWLAFEWDTRLAEQERDATSARRFPLWMGYLILGCAAFGVLLSVGIAFARSAPDA